MVFGPKRIIPVLAAGAATLAIVAAPAAVAEQPTAQRVTTASAPAVEAAGWHGGHGGWHGGGWHGSWGHPGWGWWPWGWHR